MEKDLSAHQIGDLKLVLGGRSFIVHPPSALEGVLLMKVITLGWQAAFDPKNMNEELFLSQIGQEELERLGNTQFGVERLALGDTLDEMIQAKLPAPDITMAARYASFYWVFDKGTADKMMDQDLAIKRGEYMPPPTDTELPKL